MSKKTPKEPKGVPPGYTTDEKTTPTNMTDRFIWRFTKLQVERKWTMFVAAWSVILILTMAVGSADKMGRDAFAMSPNTNYDFMINDVTQVENFDLFARTQTDADLITGAGGSTVATRSIAAGFAGVQIIYKDQGDGDVFSKANLKVACETEAKMMLHENYEKYCLLEPPLFLNTSCAPQSLSIVDHFYGFGHDYSCPELSDAAITATKNKIYSAMSGTNMTLLAKYGYFVAADFQDNGNSFTSTTRSFLALGMPLKGYDTIPCDLCSSEPQQLEVAEFYSEITKEWFDYYDMKAPNPLKTPYAKKAEKGDMLVLWMNFPILNEEIVSLLMGDMSFIVFSIFFVYIYLNVHTGSAFMATVTIWQIFLSLSVALFLYWICFGIVFFQVLQGLCIFLVLGIGADDVFVLVDAWKQSKYEIVQKKEQTRADYIHERLYFATNHAKDAVFNTTFTTSVAFIGTAISPIMPISTFGIYAAIAIVLNYVFCLLITPTAIVINESWGGFEAGWGPYCFRWCKAKVRGKPFPPEKEPPISDLSEAPEAPIPAFYEKFYLPCMTFGNKILAFITVTICIAMMVVGVYGAVQLEPPKGAEAFFGDDHPLQMAQNVLKDDFTSAADTDYAPIQWVWGTEKLDREADDFNKFKPGENRGVAVYDDDFDLYDTATQAAIMDACKPGGTIDTYTCDLDPGCEFGLFVKPGTLVCFLDEFYEWHKAHANYGAVYPNDASVTKPQFLARLADFRDTTKPAGNPVGTWEKIIGFVDGDLKYVVVEAKLNFAQFVQGQKTLEATAAKADELTKVLNDVQPDLHVFYSCFEYSWMETSIGLVTGLAIGMAIAFPAAFLTLVFATQNYIVATLAMISIGGIIVTLLGIAKLILDWPLGIVESVAAVIVVGFSVDYTIHLGHMYNHGGHEGYDTREERFKYAIKKMGGTVMGGAITTAGSGMFMFPATMLFFNKMAYMITLTIVLSVWWSLFFFMPVLLLCGPQGNTGNLAVFCKKSTDAPVAEKK